MKRNSKNHMYYDSKSESYKEVPDAPFYIVSNDTFMSGWGAAKGKVNRCIVPCQTANEALSVKAYVKSRTDQSYVRLVITRPGGRIDGPVLYSICPDWIETAKRQGF